uniref:Triple QxxK/R motif-containing protein n=1 Tax=Cyprinus carpio TaxID=7962 RepID=A0A8C1V380_CYPCA
MGKKDASSVKLAVDQYRKQIRKQDYKKTKPALRATRLKAEAKRSAPGIRVRCVTINIAYTVLNLHNLLGRLGCGHDISNNT